MDMELLLDHHRHGRRFAPGLLGGGVTDVQSVVDGMSLREIAHPRRVVKEHHSQSGSSRAGDLRDAHPLMNGDLHVFVLRERLLQRLDKCLRSPVTVVAAPAGFGKTVLARQWMASRSERRATLLSGGSTSRPQHSGGVNTAKDALQKISSGEFDVVVIDDVSTRTDGGSWSVERLLRNRHPNTHCLVLSRRSLSDTVMEGGDSVDIASEELAFTPDEVRELFEGMARLHLSDDTLRTLCAYMRGWAAPLFLAAVDCRDDRLQIERVVDTFHASCVLQEFVREEVIASLPGDLQAFLKSAMIPAWVDGSLSDVLADSPGSEWMLGALCRLGLMVEATDAAESVRFELIPVLRQTLLQIASSQPEVRDDLLRRTGYTYAKRGEIQRAVSCFVDSGDERFALEVVDESIGDIRRSRSERNILRSLTGVARAHDNEDLLRTAFLRMSAGQVELAMRLLRRIECSNASEDERILVNAISSRRVFVDGEIDSTVRAAESVLRQSDRVTNMKLSGVFRTMSPESLLYWAESALARTHWLGGRVMMACDELDALCQRKSIDAELHVQVLGSRALLGAWAGNLRIGKQYGSEAIRLALQFGLAEHPVTGDARLALASVAREQADELRARKILNQAFEMNLFAPGGAAYAMYVTERALLSLSCGDPEGGARIVDEFRMEGRSTPPLIIDDRMRAAEVRLLLAMGEPQKAAHVVDGGDLFAGGDLAAAAVQTSVEQHDLLAAREQLERWESVDA
jgi:LuxR family maltose regulon positive regulatory protein